jgi:hypothetical protein
MNGQPETGGTAEDHRRSSSSTSSSLHRRASQRTSANLQLGYSYTHPVNR